MTNKGSPNKVISQRAHKSVRKYLKEEYISRELLDCLEGGEGMRAERKKERERKRKKEKERERKRKNQFQF